MRWRGLAPVVLVSFACEADPLLEPTNGPDPRGWLDAGFRRGDAEPAPMDAGFLPPDLGVADPPDAGFPDEDAAVGLDATPVERCRCPSPPQTCTLPEVDQPFFSSDRDTLQDQLSALLACAELRLQIAMYRVEWDCVVDHLIALLNRDSDVAIELVIDDDECPLLNGTRACALSRIQNHPRVSIVDDARSRYMHHKFVLVDGARLWVGSANFEERSFCTDLNDAILIGEPGLIQAYQARFQRLSIDRQFGPAPRVAPTVAGRYAVSFGPESPLSQAPTWHTELLRAINTSSTSLDLMINAFTRTDVSDAVIAAKNRGVSVRLLVHSLYANDAPAQALFSAGLLVKKAQIHSKVLIVDNQRVYTGTPNWSTNAFENNEDSLRIDDATTALRYTAEFDRAFAAATPL